MKKRIFAVAVVLISLSVLAATTIAYFTDSDIARNVITSGGIDIQIIEQQLVDGKLVEYPNEPIPVMPSSTVSKIVSVQNTDEPAWIRAGYTVTVYDAEEKAMLIPAEELAKVIGIAPNTAAWTQKDGWWYHNTAVAAEEMTEPLFEEVVFSGPHMDNKYQNCTVVIDVTAQAVQTANNGTSVLEALGWPEAE